jgi:ribosomal protein S1
MPIPKSAPPGSVMPTEKPSAPKSANDLMAFLSFVEHHPVGTTVEAVVDSYSSHGAYVVVADAHGYVPLRLMGNPPPRSARDAVALGEVVTLVVHSFHPARRSIDLAVLSMSPDAKPASPRDTKAVKSQAGAKRTDTGKPASSKPVVKKPVVKKPAEIKPVVKKPVVKKPAEIKPVAKKPVVKKPAEIKPVVKKPADIKPVVKKSAVKVAPKAVSKVPAKSAVKAVSPSAAASKSARR